jgi:hypothetical protein
MLHTLVDTLILYLSMLLSWQYKLLCDIIYRGLATLSLFRLLRLRYIHSSFIPRIKVHFRHRFTRTLNVYFSRPKAFRKLMRKLGAVISGSTALSIVLGSHWQDQDLDIYIRKGSANPILRFLFGEGYKVRRLWSPDSDYPNAIGSQYIRRIIKLTRRLQDGTQRNVDIVESSTDSAIQPITRFHSTAVMNYISADSIMVMYPKLTNLSISVEQDREGPMRVAWMIVSLSYYRI